MRVLVTGKNGQVGRCLMDQGDSYGFNMFGMSSTELDITNIRNVDSVISQIKPDLVINAAAYTAVDKAETDMKAAYAVNETGPKLIAAICKKLDIPMFHISTDYVFDGKSKIPYKETDIVNPTSVYGRSKFMGELAVRNTLSKFIILRTSWVFSEYGANFVKTMLRLGSEREELSIVGDQYGGPTSAHSIAASLLQIAKQYEEQKVINWGVYHFSSDQYCSWYEFAQEIFIAAARTNNSIKSPKLNQITTADYPTPAIRPKNSCLNIEKIKTIFGLDGCDWRAALMNTIPKIMEHK